MPLTDHILGTLLAPLTSRRRGAAPDDAATLRSLFTALDELLADPNPNMPDVVFDSFLEPLAQDRDDWERARAYMGERMRTERRTSAPTAQVTSQRQASSGEQAG